MVFNPKPKKEHPPITIKVDNIPLQEVNPCKFLGVVLDNKFSWKDHISHLSKKLAKSVGIMSRARQILSKETLVTLYYSFI